jgi:23S rRNA pseudouridine1911/1915/1917 synthase
MPDSGFEVTKRDGGQTLAALLKKHLDVSWSQSRKLIEQRRVRVNGQVCPDPVRRLSLGNRVDVRLEEPLTKRRRTQPAGPKPPPAEAGGSPKTKSPTATPALVHIDEQIIVVEKPPGLTTMRHAEEAAEFGARAKRFLPPTLAELLPKLTGDRRSLRAVHRIDRDTSGLVVFARTKVAEADLGKQFRTHAIARKYLALVRGRPQEGRIESWLVADRGDGRRGSGPPGQGQRAVSNVRIVEELGPFTLVECQLETGRTHQVRIHLGEASAPLCGERVYDRAVNGPPLPDASGAQRTMLHAALLGLHHPATGKWLEWQSPLPADMGELLAKLRRATSSA